MKPRVSATPLPALAILGDVRSDWYIDPEKGDDKAGDGSQEKPFRTIARLRKEFQKAEP